MLDVVRPSRSLGISVKNAKSTCVTPVQAITSGAPYVEAAAIWLKSRKKPPNNKLFLGYESSEKNS